jgi:hypothetical protein
MQGTAARGTATRSKHVVKAIYALAALLLSSGDIGCSAGYADSPQLAVPGPVAFSCENDVPCGTHHCNVVYRKCAFPCQSNADCIEPNQCTMGLCVPPPPDGGH